MRFSAIVAVLAGSVAARPEIRNKKNSVNSTNCNGEKYKYLELAGYGYTPSDARDRFGDTAGGIGSSAAIDPSSWKRNNDNSYTGTLWALPDRGWNTEGTLNYQPRVHKFTVVFKPDQVNGSSNLALDYVDTIRFTDPAGTPTTGLDPDFHGPYLSFAGFPDLPSATYTGNGFGNNGTGGRRVSIDSEGLILSPDGSFWVSDEYGPFIYHFSPTGQMIKAIRPPEPYIPKRNGSDSFSANSPPRYNPDRSPKPKNGATGRHNNQGFEGLTASPDGKSIYVLLQSATNQDGGLTDNNRYTRLLQYSASSYDVLGEWVVPLPLYGDDNSVAGQSEIKYISDTQFFILARDSGAGHGEKSSLSVYRHVDVFDISKATNLNLSQFTIAPNGTLNSTIKPAKYCSFLDFNVNSQLTKFGLHNGGAQDDGLLNAKWESLALVPAKEKDEYYLFSLSDNDFITQNGYMNGGALPYADESGYDLLNQVLVFKVKLPKGSKPRVG